MKPKNDTQDNHNYDPTPSEVNIPLEVSVKYASEYLGVTQRTVVNYLRSRQLQGVKVGKVWFINGDSLKSIRRPDQSIRDIKLPGLENPLSKSQHKRQSKKKGQMSDWTFVVSQKKTPLKLSCYKKLIDAFDLVESIREELSENELEFYKLELQSIGDDLGAGYYCYGTGKLRLYSRARMKAGRLISRSLLDRVPEGLVLALSELVQSVAYLCRKMDNNFKGKEKNSESQQGKA